MLRIWNFPRRLVDFDDGFRPRKHVSIMRLKYPRQRGFDAPAGDTTKHGRKSEKRSAMPDAVLKSRRLHGTYNGSVRFSDVDYYLDDFTFQFN